MTFVMAFDLSLTAAGSAWPSGTVTTIKPGKRTGVVRLNYLRDWVLAALETVSVDIVVIEGYSYGSHGRAVVDLGELGGLIRWTLYDAGIPFVDIPPPSLKKYATGKGNASKEEVLAAAIRRLDYAGHDHNQADALWLRQMALCRYSPDDAVPMPQAHRDALAKVDWPDLTVGAS